MGLSSTAGDLPLLFLPLDSVALCAPLSWSNEVPASSRFSSVPCESASLPRRYWAPKASESPAGRVIAKLLTGPDSPTVVTGAFGIGVAELGVSATVSRSPVPGDGGETRPVRPGGSRHGSANGAAVELLACGAALVDVEPAVEAGGL